MLLMESIQGRPGRRGGILRDGVHFEPGGAQPKHDAHEMIAENLQHFDRSAEAPCLAALKTQPGVLEKVQSLIFTFNDLRGCHRMPSVWCARSIRTGGGGGGVSAAICPKDHHRHEAAFIAHVERAGKMLRTTWRPLARKTRIRGRARRDTPTPAKELAALGESDSAKAAITKPIE